MVSQDQVEPLRLSEFLDTAAASVALSMTEEGEFDIGLTIEQEGIDVTEVATEQEIFKDNSDKFSVIFMIIIFS